MYCICIPICFWSEIDLKQSKKVSPPKKHKTSLVRLLGILWIVWIVKRAPKKACVLRFRSLGPKHGPTVLRCNSLEKEGFWQKEGSGLWSKGVERCEGHPVWRVEGHRLANAVQYFCFCCIPTLKDGFVVASRKKNKKNCKNIPQSQLVFLRLLK